MWLADIGGVTVNVLQTFKYDCGMTQSNLRTLFTKGFCGSFSIEDARLSETNNPW